MGTGHGVFVLGKNRIRVSLQTRCMPQHLLLTSPSPSSPRSRPSQSCTTDTARSLLILVTTVYRLHRCAYTDVLRLAPACVVYTRRDRHGLQGEHVIGYPCSRTLTCTHPVSRRMLSTRGAVEDGRSVCAEDGLCWGTREGEAETRRRQSWMRIGCGMEGAAMDGDGGWLAESV